MIDTARALLLAALLSPIVALSQGASSSGTALQKPGTRVAASREVSQGCARVGDSIAAGPAVSLPAPTLLPSQLEVRTPLEPTVFPSAGWNYLIYELHLRNFAGEPVELQGIEVLGEGDTKALARFGAEQLPSLFFPRAGQLPADEGSKSRQLAAGQGTVAYLCLAFDSDIAVPANVRHRVVLKDAYAEGPLISTRQRRLRTFAPPVAGPDWIAAGGPGNSSHHRVGLLVIGGNARISRRLAIDWRKVREGANFAGDALDVHSYHAYGEQVFAVADGIVLSAKDGLPDNVPRTSRGFETAVPVTMETIAGNAITLDLGDGQFAFYAHLQPGSVRVKEGDRVKRGQPLGRIGNSGDSREPHVHFEVSDSPVLLAGEGLPYLIDRYDIRSLDGSIDRRANELPMLETLVDFRSADMLTK